MKIMINNVMNVLQNVKFSVNQWNKKNQNSNFFVCFLDRVTRPFSLKAVILHKPTQVVMVTMLSLDLGILDARVVGDLDFLKQSIIICIYIICLATV